MADEPVLLTVSEAATLLRIGRNTCYELVRQNRIPHIRLGRRILIARPSLLEWLRLASTDPGNPRVVEFSARQHG